MDETGTGVKDTYKPYVNAIAWKTPPSKTTYDYGDSLSLTDAEATLTDSEGFTETVAAADFASKGISVLCGSSADDAVAVTTLTVSGHNGKPLFLKYGANVISSAGATLTVNKATPTITKPSTQASATVGTDFDIAGIIGLSYNKTVFAKTDYTISNLSVISGDTGTITDSKINFTSATNGTATVQFKVTLAADPAKDFAFGSGADNTTDTVKLTVSSGKATTTSGTAAGGTIRYTGDLTDKTLASSGLSAADAAKGIKILDGTKDLTADGTWSWTTDSTPLTAGEMTNVGLTWTPNGDIDGTTYAPNTSVEATLYVKKELGAGDFQPNGTTLDKDYDGKDALPQGAKAEVTTQINGAAYTVSITGTYEDATVGAAKAITTTAVTEDAESDYYILADNLTSLTGLTGKIKKLTPVAALDNLAQTVASASSVTPAKVIFKNSAGTVLEDDSVVEGTNYDILYEIPAPTAVVNCDCGFANNLAHAVDCAYVVAYEADPTTAVTCDCAYTQTKDPEKKHADTCAYKVAGGNCDCGLGNENASDPANSANHTGCSYAAADPANKAFKAWDDGAQAYLQSLTESTSVPVKVTFKTDSTNLALNGLADVTGTFAVTINAGGNTPSGGSGGGTSSYTVKFDAGKNGKITKGNASTSVSSGSKVASSKVPTVEASEGYKFLGWSLDGKTTVDPTEQKITKSVTFTALYETLGVKSELAFDKTIPGGYMSGYPDGTFGPERSITREEVAAMFSRILTEQMEAGKSYPSVYTDVAANRWSANAIGFLSGLGVIEGYGDGTFKPEQAITRAEFISMVVRVDGVIAGEDRFSDISGHWARENIQAGAEKGFIAGYPDGSFKPQQSITRAEAVTIVNRVLGVQKGGDMPYTDVPAAHWAHDDIAAAAR